jgi:hypothetical protein
MNAQAYRLEVRPPRERTLRCRARSVSPAQIALNADPRRLEACNDADQNRVTTLGLQRRTRVRVPCISSIHDREGGLVVG